MERLDIFVHLRLFDQVHARQSFEGKSSMQISDAIRDGAEGFFRTQYGSISRMAGVLGVIILGIYMFRKSTPEQDAAGLEK